MSIPNPPPSVAGDPSFEYLLPHISNVFGWLYTICWSLSFYPQPLLNLSRQSTSGTTIDFPTINILGFIALSISNASFLYSDTIKKQYRERNGGLESSVRINDLVFAVHAVVLSLVGWSMFWPRIWGWKVDKGCRGRERKVSRWVAGVGLGCLGSVAVVTAMVLLRGEDDARTGWAWIDVIYTISYTKLFITLIKYIPQVLTNYRNQSTHGWSITQILLDVVGGFLSLTQLGIDSYLQRDWSGITGNPVKLALSNISIFFDIVFMYQHYWLYRGKKGGGEDVEEGGPLLREEVLE